jgi:hypothetical protein
MKPQGRCKTKYSDEENNGNTPKSSEEARIALGSLI